MQPQQQSQQSYNSMPIKWSPSGQHQPQQQQYQPQYQQQDYHQQDYHQQEYQDYHEQASGPKPNPQEIFARSLAKSREQQNEYLAEMQRSKFNFFKSFQQQGFFFR